MKRILAITLTLVMVLAALTGCMASKNPSGDEGEQNPSGKRLPITLTIAETLPSCVAFEYKDEKPYCFYAYDTEGHLYRVLWNDFTGLNEKDVVVVDHNDDIKKLEYVNPPEGWTPKYEVTATSIKMEKRANDYLVSHIQIKSGANTIHPFGSLLWSETDHGDGFVDVMHADYVEITDMVKRCADVIPKLVLDESVSYLVQVNGRVENVYLLTPNGDTYAKSETTFDALSNLEDGTYYVAFEVLLSGNCDPGAPQNSSRYQDIFCLVVGAEIGEIGTSDEDYGKIQFFPQPIPEFTEEDTYDTTSFLWARLTDGDMDLLCRVYNDGKGWTNDSVVDRALFMFDGRIRFATTDSFGWMYFGLEQNVLYYNGMFTTMDDNVRKSIERARQNDTNTQITFSAGEVLSQKVLSDSDKQTIMNILSIKTDNAWISDIPECDWICRFSGAVEVGYCDCGTLSDFANHRSRKLTNAEKEKIEELIKRYKYNSNEECFDNVIGKVPLHPLYEKYPEYWDVDGMKGVEVYVWQIEDGSYRCGALTGTNRLKTDEEIQALFDNGATIEEMRTILELCEVAKDHISLIPIRNPLADNWYEIDINDEALLKVQTLFWGE